MATIFRRSKHLRLKPDQQTKMAIGKEVVETFFALPKRARIFKITSVEPEGTFQALSYPKSFHDTIDKIILKHCAPKNRRPRINKVGSSKP